MIHRAGPGSRMNSQESETYFSYLLFFAVDFNADNQILPLITQSVLPVGVVREVA